MDQVFSTANNFNMTHEASQYKPFDSFKNLKGSEELTTQAKTLIQTVDEEILFVQEQFNRIWTMYLVVKANGDIVNLKFCRDTSDETAYQPSENDQSDDDIFEDIHYILFPAESDIVYNKNHSELSKPAQSVINKMKENPLGYIFFTGEKKEYGDVDKHGPTEYFWSLYVFIHKDDGTIIHRKFFREFNYFHDKCNMNDIPYEETDIGKELRKMKFFI